MDERILYRLCNLINRRNVVSDPEANEAASKDFMMTVNGAHILTAAMDLFKMDSSTDIPNKSFFFS